MRNSTVNKDRILAGMCGMVAGMLIATGINWWLSEPGEMPPQREENGSFDAELTITLNSRELTNRDISSFDVVRRFEQFTSRGSFSLAELEALPITSFGDSVPLQELAHISIVLTRKEATEAENGDKSEAENGDKSEYRRHKQP